MRYNLIAMYKKQLGASMINTFENKLTIKY